MGKELEALKSIKIRCHSKSMRYDPIDFDLETIEQALKRLEAIDNSNPSEALKSLEKLGTHRIEYREGFELGFTKTMPFKSTMEYKIIEQALLKAQEQEKENELLKEIIKGMEI